CCARPGSGRRASTARRLQRGRAESPAPVGPDPRGRAPARRAARTRAPVGGGQVRAAGALAVGRGPREVLAGGRVGGVCQSHGLSAAVWPERHHPRLRRSEVAVESSPASLTAGPALAFL